MEPAEFKQLLEENGLTVQDVKNATEVNPITIYKYLAGGPVNRSTRRAFEKYAEEIRQAKTAAHAG